MITFKAGNYQFIIHTISSECGKTVQRIDRIEDGEHEDWCWLPHYAPKIDCHNMDTLTPVLWSSCDYDGVCNMETALMDKDELVEYYFW